MSNEKMGVGLGVRTWGSLVLGIISALSLTASWVVAEPRCAEEVLAAVQTFDQAWEKDFSRYPSLTQKVSLARRRLLQSKGLSVEVRQWLEKHPNPLALGDRTLLRAYELAYGKLIEASSANRVIKESLKSSLSQAVEALSQDLPPAFETPTLLEEPSSEPAPEAVIEIFQELKSEGMQRCLVRAGILFFSSNVINTAGALQAKWEKYAGAQAGWIEQLVSKETWQNAVQDSDFRHNVVWNAIMMGSMGALTCLQDKHLGKNLITAVAAACSITGQYLTSGEVKLSQVLLDALFVRYISINKSTFTFRAAEKYARAGLPAPVVVETGMQFISEGTGSYLYPRAVYWNKWLWGLSEGAPSREPSSSREGRRLAD